MEYREVSVPALFTIVFSLLVAIVGIVVASIGIVNTKGESKCGEVEVASSSDHVNLIISLVYVVAYAVLLIVLILFVIFTSTRSSNKTKDRIMEMPELVASLYKFLSVFALGLWASQTIELSFDCNNFFGIWLFSFMLVELILYIVIGVLEFESRLFTSSNNGTTENVKGRGKTGRTYKKMKKMGN